MHDRGAESLKKKKVGHKNPARAGWSQMLPNNLVFIIDTSALFDDIFALTKSRREREENLSWAEATSRLLTN